MSEDYQYTPQIPAQFSNSDPELVRWISDEFSRIGNALYQKIGMYGQNGAWYDSLTSIQTGKLGLANNPTWSAFGTTGTNYAYSFIVNDYIQLAGFHINHDIKRNSYVYPHVHWTTNGTSTATVKWEMSYTYAKGHNQEAFPADTVVTVEQAASGTAWQHMIAEVADGDAFLAPEVDSIIMMRLRRITNGGTDNANTVFGLFVDLHYQRERTGTPNKAPDFYD